MSTSEEDRPKPRYPNKIFELFFVYVDLLLAFYKECIVCMVVLHAVNWCCI